MTRDAAADPLAADRLHMARALDLAARGLYTTDPNPRVGCVLVREGRVIGEGWHARAGEPHAEILALRAAGGDARGATAYVTLEPCSHTGRTPPCADALIAARIGRVVCATADPNPKVAGGGIERLRAAGIAASSGLMQREARELNAGFFSRFERGRPLIRLKLAMSLDARTAPATSGARWITGEAARADVQAWRARSSAVVTGAGTVRVDDPRLDVRLDYGPWVRQPLRVVLDPELTCAASARVFDGGHALVFAAAEAVPTQALPQFDGHAMPSPSQPQPAGRPEPSLAQPHMAGRPMPLQVAERADAAFRIEVPVVRVSRSARGVDLRAVIGHLTALEANELWVECGARLAAGFLEAGLVDELILYVAPMFLGTDAAPLASLSDLASGSVPGFEFRDQGLIGNDLRLVLTPKRV